MKLHYLLCCVTALLLGMSSPSAQANVNIFACEPEWAALAAEIGGDKVKIFAATHAEQDPHHIRARPSLIAKARHADLLFCSGGGLEEGWLPLLLRKASAQVQPGADGFLMATNYVPMLEKPERLDRSMGHVHAAGNPHVYLNPNHLLLVASELAKRLGMIDAANASFYQANLTDFSASWNEAIQSWRVKAAPLQGKTVIVHHRAFSYLLDWLGMKEVASLEPTPGIPPTSSHLESLLQQFKAAPADVIVRTPYEPDDASEWLSEKTGTPAIMLPYTAAGDGKQGELFMLFESSISHLLEATR